MCIDLGAEVSLGEAPELLEEIVETAWEWQLGRQELEKESKEG